MYKNGYANKEIVAFVGSSVKICCAHLAETVWHTIMSGGDTKADKQLGACSSRGDVAGVRNALQYGASVNAFDCCGQTPLHKAAASGCEDAVQVVQILLQAHGNPNAENNDGVTPADQAIYWALRCKSVHERRQCLDALEAIVDAGGTEGAMKKS